MIILFVVRMLETLGFINLKKMENSILLIMKNKRLSSQSAIAPDSIPRKNNGAMRAAAATPTMKAEPVMSNTSQPTATCSIPVPTE